MKVFMRACWVLLLHVGLISCKNKSERNAGSVESDLGSSRMLETASFSLTIGADTGMQLYGRYFFDSRGGGLSAIYKENVEVVPPGSAIVVVNQNYIIGSYEGAGYVVDSRGRVRFQKIFFCVDKQGKFEFGLPYDKDPRVMGEAISGRVIFDAYEPSIE